MNTVLVITLKLLHAGFASLFYGAILAMVFVQSLLQRSLDDGERKSLARAANVLGRFLINPLAYLAVLLGIVLWLKLYLGAEGGLMKASPPYIHVMLLFGILAMGFAQMWKGRVRKLVVALEAGQSANEFRAHLARGWIFAFASFICAGLAFAAGVVKVPF